MTALVSSKACQALIVVIELHDKSKTSRLQPVCMI